MRKSGKKKEGKSRSAALTQALLGASLSTGSASGLKEQYYNLCMERLQKVNPFIGYILQQVDEEMKEGTRSGITLNIAGNNHLVQVQRITGADFCVLSKILKNHSCITGVDARYNSLGSPGAYYAAKLLQKQPSLVYLNLMFNDIQSDGGELIAKALQKNKTLKYLRMTGNKIENKGGMCFATMLQINSSLEKLDVGDCDLEESTVHIGHMLKENHCLMELHLCKHGMQNDGLQQLCEALYLNSTLRYLDVSCNKITQDGMLYLAAVLKSNATLEVIDLSFNRIESAGAKHLSKTLASHNRSLKALSVVSNKIDGEGLIALSDSMKTNPILSNIYIWGNTFDEATCVAYSELIEEGRLQADNTDVEPFVVDEHVYLAESPNGLKKHYYWTPTYGHAYGPTTNAGFALVPVGEHL
ncbi:leucine-rich repeat-containing protein 34 isoform 2-T2 [Thomomys bottae]